MENCRERWYDAEAKVAVTFVDVTEAAQALARGHLMGPAAAYYLAKALAAAALLGAEASEKDEVLSIQMKCSGPLGGFNVECTADGKLRGYTEKKILDDFDGLGNPDARKVVGDKKLQITRSVPGRIISQGIAASLDSYLSGSLQRKATIRLEAAVNDDVEILGARGVLVEDMPDREGDLVCCRIDEVKSLGVAGKNVLKQLGLTHAELKTTEPLAFGCGCSQAKAESMLAALSLEERKNLPASIAITCHKCGRTYTVKI